MKGSLAQRTVSCLRQETLPRFGEHAEPAYSSALHSSPAPKGHVGEGPGGHGTCCSSKGVFQRCHCCRQTCIIGIHCYGVLEGLDLEGLRGHRTKQRRVQQLIATTAAAAFVSGISRPQTCHNTRAIVTKHQPQQGTPPNPALMKDSSKLAAPPPSPSSSCRGLPWFTLLLEILKPLQTKQRRVMLPWPLRKSGPSSGKHTTPAGAQSVLFEQS